MKKLKLVITHGDVDGIISAILLMKYYELDSKNARVEFVQPFTVDNVDLSGVEEVYVADVAINNRDPGMTKKFVADILAQNPDFFVWFEHHRGSQELKKMVPNPLDTIFVDETQPSCAQLIQLRCAFPKAEKEEVERLVKAANAIDSRQGKSDLGDLLDKAMRVNLSDDSVRFHALNFLLGREDDTFLKEKVKGYEAIQAETERLLKISELKGNVLVVNTIREDIKPYDRTQIFLKGYGQAPFVVVLAEFKKRLSTTVGTSRKDIDLVKLFNLPSGAPSRVSLEGNRVEEVIKKLTTDILEKAEDRVPVEITKGVAPTSTKRNGDGTEKMDADTERP